MTTKKKCELCNKILVAAEFCICSTCDKAADADKIRVWRGEKTQFSASSYSTGSVEDKVPLTKKRTKAKLQKGNDDISK